MNKRPAGGPTYPVAHICLPLANVGSFCLLAMWTIQLQTTNTFGREVI
jgi:hypothetical protein